MAENKKTGGPGSFTSGSGIGVPYKDLGKGAKIKQSKKTSPAKKKEVKPSAKDKR